MRAMRDQIIGKFLDRANRVGEIFLSDGAIPPKRLIQVYFVGPYSNAEIGDILLVSPGSAETLEDGFVSLRDSDVYATILED